jgi:predicted phosphodiesterase/transposase-like protein
VNCLGANLPERWWQDKELFVAELDAHGTPSKIEEAHGVAANTLSKWRRKHGLPKLQPGNRPAPVLRDGHDDWLLEALKKQGDDATVEQIADAADVSPKRVREAAERLGHAGFRVEQAAGRIVLDRVLPDRDHLHTLSPKLFDGDLLRVGIVSDTHLGANEEALDELHLAYDIFQQEGISEVWHAGDWGTGVGMFKTHHAESKVHTAEAQVDYLVENYPARKGILTRGISGNHDLEGDFGRLGFDPVRPFAAQRDDIEYLGEYSAWLELREGTGSWVHLLHGAGGMSYSYSYKAQKLVDGYPSGRKPAVLIVGHWHVKGNIRARDVEVVWPGCFEWQSRFLKRLGLHPAVGLHPRDARRRRRIGGVVHAGLEAVLRWAQRCAAGGVA